MTTDSKVRERALDPETSFLVEAPAGSGKTELLIQRYLRLLATVEQPESIVALTFTRKAAAEMKERVLSALREAVEKTPADSEWARTTRALAEAALARASVLDWHLLEDSRRLQIGTIDSFSSLLTHQMPLLARFGSNPEVIEFATDLYRTAARRAIIALAEHPDFQTIFREITVHFDGDLTRLEKLIAALLGKRDQWDRRLDGAAGDSLRDEIDSLLEEEILERQVAAFSAWPPGIPGRPAVALAAVPEWQATLDALLALPEIGGPVGFSGGVTAVAIGLAAVDPRIAALGLFAGSYVPRSLVDEARGVTIPLHMLLQWDDEGNDRQQALDLFDVFGSREKTLQANLGGHRGVPAHAGEDAARFFVRHLG